MNDICHYCGQEMVAPRGSSHRRDMPFIQVSQDGSIGYFKVKIVLHFHETCYSTWFQRQDLTLV